MKTETSSETLPIARFAVKGSCPVCSAVQHFQDSLPGRLHVEGRTQLCNFHAWLPAKSASAEVAASLFLHALGAKEQDATVASPRSCIACEKIREEEAARLGEATGELEGGSLAGVWFQQHARFCLRHVCEVKKQVPAALRKTIVELNARNAAELETELEKFLQQARQGDRTGDGALGRAAEFLVAQRGILD
jgi:hypothetical protein